VGWSFNLKTRVHNFEAHFSGMDSANYVLGMVILFWIFGKYCVASNIAACKRQVADRSFQLKYKSIMPSNTTQCCMFQLTRTITRHNYYKSLNTINKNKTENRASILSQQIRLDPNTSTKRSYAQQKLEFIWGYKYETIYKFKKITINWWELTNEKKKNNFANILMFTNFRNKASDNCCDELKRLAHCCTVQLYSIVSVFFICISVHFNKTGWIRIKKNSF